MFGIVEVVELLKHEVVDNLMLFLLLLHELIKLRGRYAEVENFKASSLDVLLFPY